MRFIFLIISIIVGVLLFVTTSKAEAPTTVLPELDASEMIAIYFGKDAERMKQIFTCESGLRQFDSKGNVIMSHTRDFGIAQINEKTWDKKAKELDLDYKGSMVDNLKMAKYVYTQSGHRAWVCNNLI